MRNAKNVSRCAKLLVLGVTTLVFGLILSHGLFASAAEFNYQTSVDYIVDGTGNTHIAQRYTVTNNTPRTILDTISISTPTDEANNLKVSYSDGATIPSTVTKKTANVDGYTYNYLQIDVKFNRTNAGSGLNWSFSVDYETSKLVEIKGSAKTVFIPAVGQSSITEDYAARLQVPDNFGKVHTTGVKPTYAGVIGGKATYVFDRKDLLRQSVTLAFGDSTIYNINFNFPLKNDSDRVQNMTVTLPPDTASQKIFINKLDPKPENLHLDSDGNVLAEYKVPAKSTVTVKTDIDGLVKYLEYDLAKSKTKADIPANLVHDYTDQDKYWQANNSEILIKASQAVAGSGDKVADQIKAINKYVVDTLSYNNEKIKYNIRQGAVNALENPTNAVCLEYSDLMVALLRSQGIPARMPVGYAYSGNLKATSSVSDSLHSWVEAYVPGVGWINVDPTWSEKFNSYGVSDLDHFAFALWGKSDSSPSAVMAKGEDQNYQYEDAKLSFKDVAPISATTGSLAAKKYIVFPFVSVVQYAIVAPQNVSGDNYQVEISTDNSSVKTELGSLAAGQKISGFVPFIGNNYQADQTARFIQAQEGVPVLAVAEVQTLRWPMYVVIALLSVIILLVVVKSILARYRKRHPKKEPLAPLGDTNLNHTAKKNAIAKKFRTQAKFRIRKK